MIKRTAQIKRSKPLQRKIQLKRKNCSNNNTPTGDYYQQGISMSTWRCEECGEYIPHSSFWQQIAAQCHILPKEIFQSIAKLIQNRLHLCLRCHNDFDSSWEKASSMKVFPLAIERLKTISTLLSEREYPKIPNCFTHVFASATPLVPMDYRHPSAPPDQICAVNPQANRVDPANPQVVSP
jgi:hypothetical protein